MPEGPEVRRAADKIEKAVAKKEIVTAKLLFPNTNDYTSKIIGHQLQQIKTYGKAFVLFFENDIVIYVHLQLYGVWKTGRKNTPVKTKRSLRIWLETDTHYAALYSATDISIHTSKTIYQHSYIQKLGLDILNRPSLNAGHISRHIGKKKYQGRQIGHLLLDQSFIAGVGNYLRSEILFEARLHPTLSMKKLTPKQKTALARAIYTMMHRAYKTGGITTATEIIKSAKALGKRRRQYRHYVFTRQNQKCYVCKTKIQKKEITSRRLYFCPSCQQLDS